MAIRDYRPATNAPGPARTPQISLAVAGDSSGAQRLGAAVAGVGETLERSRQATELNDARLAMTEGLGALNRDLAEDTDFDSMGARYKERLDALGNAVLEQASTPGLKRQLSLEMARARVAAEARVTDRQFSLRGSHSRATLARTLRQTASSIPTAASEEEAGLTYERAQTAIDEALAAGYIDAEAAETARATLDQDVSQGLVLAAINEDAGSAAARLSEPGAFGLEEVERQRYLATATRAAESKARTTRSKLEQRLDTARGLLVRGHEVPGEELAALQAEVAGSDLETELDAALTASEQLGKFAAATPRERAAYLSEVREQGISIDDATIGRAHLATLEAIDRDLAGAETEELRSVGARVEAAVTALGDGRAVADLDAVRAAAAGTPFADDLDLAERRADFVTAYRAADRQEQERLLKEARDGGVITANRTHDEAFLDTLEEIDRSAARAISADPVQYAIDNGVPGAAPLDLADRGSAQDRMAVVTELNAAYGADALIFTEKERASYKKAANEGSPEEQLAFVVSVIDGFGPAAEAAFDEIDGLDPVVRRAGDLVFETGSDEVAGIILAGRKAMQAGDELRVPSEDALTVFEDSIDGVLRARPGRREEIIEAAKAYYAYMAPGRVGLTDLDEQTDLLAEGVQRVLGGSKLRGRLYGGIQQVNGRRVKLPPSLDAEAAEELLGTASLEDWRAASLSGAGPHEGEAELLPEGAVLQWVEGSTYRVGVRSRRGEVEWYQDPAVDNGYFYVDLDRLAGSVLRRRQAAAQAAEGRVARDASGRVISGEAGTPAHLRTLRGDR